MKPVTTTGLQTVSGRTRMLLALALVLATLLAAAAPALAQETADEERADQKEAEQEAGTVKEGVDTKREATDEEEAARVAGPATATGLLGRAAPHSPDPTPVYAISDEATGTPYELVSGFVDLEQYVGERITIQGVPVPGPGDPNKPPLLNVTQVEPADDGEEDDPPAVKDEATLSFELTVDGDPPAGAAFYGNVKTGEGGPGLYVPLTDPDGDRVYTGSTTVDRFGPGPRPVPQGVEPVSLPVQIVHGSEVIKDFGSVKLDGDKTFEASVSFPVDDCPIISPTPEQCGDGGSGGSDDNDGLGDGSNGGGSGVDSTGGEGGSAGSGNGGSGNGASSNGASSNGASSNGASGNGGFSNGGSGNGGSGSGGDSSVASGISGLLPNTGGGLALWLLGAGALMAGAGSLIRRSAR